MQYRFLFEDKYHNWYLCLLTLPYFSMRMCSLYRYELRVRTFRSDHVIIGL